MRGGGGSARDCHAFYLLLARKKEKRQPSTWRAGMEGGEDLWKEEGFVTASVATGPVSTIVFRERFCIGATEQRERKNRLLRKTK
jgi:hypothetical protein